MDLKDFHRIPQIGEVYVFVSRQYPSEEWTPQGYFGIVDEITKDPMDPNIVWVWLWRLPTWHRSGHTLGTFFGDLKELERDRSIWGWVRVEREG